MYRSVRTRVPLMAGVLAAMVLAPAVRAEDAASPIAVLQSYADTHEEQAAPATASAPAEAAKPAAVSAAAPSTSSARQRILPLIEKAARDHSLPPSLLDAVVRVESRYNPNVRHAGAIGLMQIKLATARGIGFTGDAAALGRPETNLQWGAKYLARAYQLSKGDTCLTLARYQGGHQVASMTAAGKAYCAKVRTVLAQLD